MGSRINIRSEQAGDEDFIFDTHTDAFRKEKTAKLVDNLRKNLEYNPQLSHIAFVGNEAVGHILFYPLRLENENKKQVKVLGLFPLGVKKKYQKQGIGSQLIQKGFEEAKELGFEIVFVVGDPRYYAKFGFKKVQDIEPDIKVPEEAFMVYELKKDALKEVKGNLFYPKEIHGLE